MAETRESLAQGLAADILGRADFRVLAEAIPDVAAGYAVQDVVATLLGNRLGGVAGYKIAWNTPALMAAHGVSEPGAARLFRRWIVEDGAELDPGDYATLMIEPEIAAVMAGDPGPEAGAADALAAVERLVPAFEILDRRRVAGPPHAPSIIAANVFNRGVVLGSGGAGPRDLSRLAASVVIGGEIALDGVGTAPQPPGEAIAFLARHFGRRGSPLKAGDIVMCGSHTPLLAVPPGAEAVWTIDGLGEVAFTLSE